MVRVFPKLSAPLRGHHHHHYGYDRVMMTAGKSASHTRTGLNGEKEKVDVNSIQAAFNTNTARDVLTFLVIGSYISIAALAFGFPIMAFSPEGPFDENGGSGADRKIEPKKNTHVKTRYLQVEKSTHAFQTFFLGASRKSG